MIHRRFSGADFPLFDILNFSQPLKLDKIFPLKKPKQSTREKIKLNLMGVTGLIKFVEAATKPGRIEQLRGCTVAIDSYCLLHKGSYSCSDKMVS